jgi:hypothetical protein
MMQTMYEVHREEYREREISVLMDSGGPPYRTYVFIKPGFDGAPTERIDVARPSPQEAIEGARQQARARIDAKLSSNEPPPSG